MGVRPETVIEWLTMRRPPFAAVGESGQDLAKCSPEFQQAACKLMRLAPDRAAGARPCVRPRRANPGDSRETSATAPPGPTERRPHAAHVSPGAAGTCGGRSTA